MEAEKVGPMRKPTEREEELAKHFVDAAIEVHRKPGPGDDEILYANALAVELEKQHIPHESEKLISVFAKEFWPTRNDWISFWPGKLLLNLKQRKY